MSMGLKARGRGMEGKQIPERAREWCFRFGMIAVKRGMITREQVREALLEQLEDDLNEQPHRLLGEILLEKDWMNGDQIERILRDLFAKDKAEFRSTLERDRWVRSRSRKRQGA
jgi:hypothetical protein